MLGAAKCRATCTFQLSSPSVCVFRVQAQQGTSRVLQSNGAAGGAKNSDCTTPGACKVSVTGAGGAGGNSTLWQAAARQPNNTGSHLREGCGKSSP
jgi:hypothetical protein